MCSDGAEAFSASCFQELYLTATINAFALTSDKPVFALQLPVPHDYIGLARQAPSSPHMRFGFTDKVDGGVPEKVLQMVDEMVQDPRQHLDNLKVHHKSITKNNNNNICRST